MLVETQYLTNSKKLVVSYVDKTGDIKLKYYNWEDPMKYVACEDNDPQKHPEFKSWDGKSVKQIEVNHPDRYAIYEFLDSLPQSEKDEIFKFNLPNICTRNRSRTYNCMASKTTAYANSAIRAFCGKCEIRTHGPFESAV